MIWISGVYHCRVRKTGGGRGGGGRREWDEWDGYFAMGLGCEREGEGGMECGGARGGFRLFMDDCNGNESVNA